MGSTAERIGRCAHFNGHQRKKIRLTALLIQLRAGLVASPINIAGADIDSSNTRMRVLCVGVDSICWHHYPRNVGLQTRP